MAPKLHLSFLVLFIKASLATWQHVTVMEGETLTLTCPVTQAHRAHVEWKNPEGYLMFFNRDRVLKDKRYSIDKLSNTQFTVSVSDVSFSDGGNYTCHQYKHGVVEKMVEVTVLGPPKMDVVKHGGKWAIKCTAEGNHHPPRISWGLGNRIEVAGKAYHHFENGTRTYLAGDTIQIQTPRRRAVVKCLVHHPALHTEPLMNFVVIGKDSKKLPNTASTRSPTTKPHSPAATPPAPTQSPGAKETTETSTTSRLYWPSSEGSISLSAVSGDEPAAVTSSTRKHLGSTNDAASPVSASGGTPHETVSEVQSTTGKSLVPESVVTDENTSHNGKEGNSTSGTPDEMERQMRNEGGSLLVFLVTCLILSLLVVVIFFVIKLRSAHIRWKRENEESEQSVESSKSKSSSEERQFQSQRHKGLFNSAFTQYVAEEPGEKAAAAAGAGGAAGAGAGSRPHEAPPPHVASSSATNHIKETEL
ncbi:cytotoxic and regulatory T-cell molecule isoform X2 [Lampris incognitus]|uniref:cytotoxic and regulatory T-cell molecule isoform X2 n=1 Tax=Lampris incognitus TaxID=2546036 RepID=UPI0024B58F68|nr:cytotoxic and regulatory T-cell molecule isoform X2 [Lampris incognitus]